MRTAEEIIARLKELPPNERRRVVKAVLDMEAIDSDTDGDPAGRDRGERGPYARSLELAGTMHSDFNDLSTDKRRHLAEAVAEKRVFK